jgi:hypothetical protein
VTQVSEILGKPYIPHQRYVVDVALEIDPETNLPAYDVVVIVMPRQCGKTELLLPVMTHRATGFGPMQRIIYTTQTGSEARKKWEDIHVKRLEASPFDDLFDTRLRLNAEAMMWRNGSTWSPIAPTIKTGGTGDTVNLGVIDEAWSRPDAATELGMRPAMLTQPNRQLWVASMVPGVSRARGTDSAYLRNLIRRGIAKVRAGVTSGMALFLGGAPEDADPGDPATGWGCMPALGHTIPEAAVRSDYEAMDLIDFCAEYLSWWPQEHVPQWTAIRRVTWDALSDPTSSISGPMALAVDMDWDRAGAYIGAAGRRADGDWHVEIIEPGFRIPAGTAGVDWVENRVVEIVEKWSPCTVVIARNGPAASLIVPLKRRGIEVYAPSAQDVAGACGAFFDATGERAAQQPERDPGVRVHHLGAEVQPDLYRAVAGSRKLVSPSNRTFVWERAGATSVSPLYCVTLAMHGHEVMAPEEYNMLDSIPRVDGQCEYCDAFPIDGMKVQHYPDCERPRA